MYPHTAAVLSATVDQPDRSQNATTVKGLSQAVISLNREFRAVLVNEEVAGIGRAVAQIVRGDGWYEAKASAVLATAIVGWLGSDAVVPLGFFGHGIETEDDLTRNACERHRARFSQSRLDELDLGMPNTRFTMGSPLAQRAADRLSVVLAEEIDPEIARVVLGVM